MDIPPLRTHPSRADSPSGRRVYGWGKVSSPLPSGKMGSGGRRRAVFRKSGSRTRGFRWCPKSPLCMVIGAGRRQPPVLCWTGCATDQGAFGQARMKTLFAIAVITSAVLSAQPLAAAPGDFTASILYEFCDGPDGPNSMNSVACTAFIRGVMRGLEMAQSLSAKGVSFCMPKGATMLQLRLAVQKYIRDHPMSNTDDAGAIAATALAIAYPCPKSN